VIDVISWPLGQETVTLPFCGAVLAACVVWFITHDPVEPLS
jgi:hypothetical protein